MYSLVVKKRWTQDRGESAQPAWTYAYPYGAAYDSIVTGPRGEKTEYKFLPGTAHPSMRRVRTADNVLVEEERREYALEQGVAYAASFNTRLITKREIDRDGRTYTTTFDYRSTHFGDYHRPWKITETDGVGPTRTTEHDYFHSHDVSHTMGHLSVGHLLEKRLKIGTETFVQKWELDNNPALVKSETIHDVKTTFSAGWIDGFSPAVTDANGNSTQQWHSWGVVREIHTPAHRWAREVREDGTIASETEGLGTARPRRTFYRYDNAFRVRAIRPEGLAETTITPNLDTNGFWVSTTAKRGGATSTTHLDGFGRLILTTTPSTGVSVKTAYDTEGRITHEGYPVQGCTQIPLCPESFGSTIEYDELGRVTKRTNPGGTFVTFAYGPGTLTIRDESDTSENGRQIVQRFQAFGDPNDARLVGVKDASSGTTGKEWLYEYNALGKLKQVTAPDGKTRTWLYKPVTGWLETETHPESGPTTYTYGTDKMGLVQSKTDAKDQTIAFEYDGNNRLKKITPPAPEGATTITFEPGTDGRATVENDDVQITYRYDAAGRLQKIETRVTGFPDAFETEFTFDGNDNLTALLYPSPSKRRVRMDYDGENRMTAVRDVLSQTAYASNIQYHPSGAVSSYTPGNSTTPFTFGYDPQRYWPHTIHAGPLSLEYAYDEVGNVTSIVDGRGSGWQQTFTYDNLDRLLQANGPYGSIGYSYDDHGNMLSQGADKFTYHPDTLRLQTRSGQNVTHDDNGNVTAGLRSTDTYAYNPHNQMKTATVGGAVTAFTYDADQWRVKKVLPNGVTTYYLRDAGGRLLTEVTVNGANPPTFRDYIYAGSRLIAVVEPQPEP